MGFGGTAHAKGKAVNGVHRSGKHTGIDKVVDAPIPDVLVRYGFLRVRPGGHWKGGI